MQLEPYLFFDGRCEEAMEYYKSVFGGELELNRYAGSPIETDAGPDYGQKVMHATLRADGFTIMGSDRPGTTRASSEQNYSLSLATNDEARGRAVFDALADGGSVRMPLEKAFWGGTFGMCADRFGIAWMVSIHAG